MSDYAPYVKALLRTEAKVLRLSKKLKEANEKIDFLEREIRLLKTFYSTKD